MPKITIVNVVATASLCQELDFYELRESREIFHDSDVYGGVAAYFKTKEMKGKVSIFTSGKMISVGTKSKKQAFSELELAKNFLVNKGFVKQVKLVPKVQNIVATTDFERSINLEIVAGHLRAMYEPEQFPGVILRFEKPFKVSTLVFGSGKVVLAGLKSSDQIEPTVKQIEQLLKPAFT